MPSRVKAIIANLMAAIETPGDLSKKDVEHLLEDANIFLESHQNSPHPEWMVIHDQILDYTKRHPNVFVHVHHETVPEGCESPFEQAFKDLYDEMA